jgi:hypothetical protein
MRGFAVSTADLQDAMLPDNTTIKHQETAATRMISGRLATQ